MGSKVTYLFGIHIQISYSEARSFSASCDAVRGRVYVHIMQHEGAKTPSLNSERTTPKRLLLGFFPSKQRAEQFVVQYTFAVIILLWQFSTLLALTYFDIHALVHEHVDRYYLLGYLKQTLGLSLNRYY